MLNNLLFSIKTIIFAAKKVFIMENLLLILSLIGGIALCLYGMKVMSQGVLKVAGARMRAALRTLGKSRVSGFGTGFWITALIQSSSAMTLMTVSLVNAGLLTLDQSIGIMMGANVGTTITAWIIAIFGYGWNIAFLAIPIIALALPFIYTSKIKGKPWGEVLMGLAIFVLGFTTFIASIPSISDFPTTIGFIHGLSAGGFGSIILFLAIGIGCTILFRSSAATIMLAMVLLAADWIDFHIAAAMVIGDNVGTTLTAVFASHELGTTGKRAAYSHLIFNLIGMIWALLFIYPISSFLCGVTTVFTNEPTPTTLAIGIALFHTLFNLLTAVLLLPITRLLSKQLCSWFPQPKDSEDEFHLHFLQNGLLSTAEISVEEARKEAMSFGVRCKKMFRLTSDFMHMSDENEEYTHTYSRIEKYEKITDRLEMEIVRFLGKIDKSSVSEHIANRIRALYRVVDELESIGDACYSIARSIMRKNEHKIELTQAQNSNIDNMLAHTTSAIDQMVALLQKTELVQEDIDRSYRIQDTIKQTRNTLRDQNIVDVQAGLYSYSSGTLYMDIIGRLSNVGDYIVNVIEAQAEQSGLTKR